MVKAESSYEEKNDYIDPQIAGSFNSEKDEPPRGCGGGGVFHLFSDS